MRLIHFLSKELIHFLQFIHYYFVLFTPEINCRLWLLLKQKRQHLHFPVKLFPRFIFLQNISKNARSQEIPIFICKAGNQADGQNNGYFTL